MIRNTRKYKSKKNKGKKFKTLKCAPNQKNNITNELKDLSCYNKNEIFNMKNIWNSKNSNKILSNDPKEIWKFFKKKLSKKCYNELCWLNDETFNSEINKNILIKNIFRPFSPDSWKNKPYEWLSSVDIINVMSQYESKYNEFIFIGPSPIDFDDKKLYGTCVWEKLCKFDINVYIKKKKSKIGIIFNTDPHYKSGSHWISLFVDIKKKFIFYFDSNGDKIPNRIKILVNRIIEQGHRQNINFEFITNEGIEHQLKDGQCGMYSLYFIIELLEERKNPEYFRNHRISDEKMKDYRNKYYNTN